MWAIDQADDASLPRLLMTLFDLLVEGRAFDPAYEHHASKPTIAMAQKRLRAFGFVLSDDGTLSGNAQLDIAAGALMTLPDLHDHIRRISLALGSEDSALLLGSAKELIETTSKFVLTELDRPLPDDFPGLLSEALAVLGLHPKGSSADGTVAAATRRVLGGLQQIGLGVNELRNAHGTGHGRVKAVKLSLRHAKLAAGSAVVLATVMVDTFEDQSAPWRVGRDAER